MQFFGHQYKESIFIARDASQQVLNSKQYIQTHTERERERARERELIQMGCTCLYDNRVPVNTAGVDGFAARCSEWPVAKLRPFGCLGLHRRLVLSYPPPMPDTPMGAEDL